jgi:hypothetical protein
MRDVQIHAIAGVCTAMIAGQTYPLQKMDGTPVTNADLLPGRPHRVLFDDTKGVAFLDTRNRHERRAEARRKP